MSDRVHPAVNAVQASCPDPATATPLVYTHALKLLERNHAVLPRGNPGDDRIWRLLGAFPTHGGG